MDAEGASCYLGPRYAFVPPDPTLPEPWKGLIDGSTGLMYYWNTVTNVTQYEKPTAVQKPMFSTPEQQMRPQQRNGRFQLYQGVNLKQSQSYQVTRDQPMHYMGYQQWPSNMRQPLQRLKQFRQQQDHRAAFPHRENGLRVQNKRSNVNLVQTPPAKEGSLVQNRTLDVNPVQTSPAQNGTLLINQASDVNPVQTPPAKRGPLVQNQPSDVKPVQTPPAQKGPLVQNQPSDVNHVQTTPAQKGSLLQNQPLDVNHVQTPPAKKGPLVQNQPLDVNPVNPPPTQNGPLVQSQPSDVNPVQTPPTQNGPLVRNQPSDANPVQTPPTQNGPLVRNQPSDANPVQTPPTESVSSQFQMQQPWTCGQSQQSVADCQQHDIPPVGLKTGFEDNSPGRDKNDPSFDAKNGGPDMVPHQSKLAAIPMANFFPEMDSVDLVHHNVSPTLPGGPNTCNMHVQASGGPTLMNNANPAVIVSPDAMTLSSVDIYRKKHYITAMGDNVPAPFMSFESTGFPPELLREVRYLFQKWSTCRTLYCNLHIYYRVRLASSEIYAAGFASPTPIQAQTWPIALQNRDMVAIAKTGSDKTLGYLIPAFMLLRRCNNNRQHGPTVIVLSPTKELATQIQNEAIKFGQFVRISCTCLYGGAPEGPQLKDLERGAHIVVASPGRLNDIIEMRKLDFRQVSLFVLDEADRLLDMGFEPQIRKIVNEIPHQRQTLMYTATWTKEVRKLANDLLDNAIEVNIGNADELAANKFVTQANNDNVVELSANKSITQVNIGNADELAAKKSITQVNIGNADELAANKSITQYVEVVPHMEKHRRVEQILRSEERGSKTIIFCSTKKCCDQLTYSISGKFGAAAIHGEKSLGQRDSVLNQFHSGKFPVLVVTDVAAPGLDIKDVRVVINYDFPNGVEDYVRRIGLTGKAGTKGVAYTFFSEQDWKHAADLIKVLEEANQPVPHEVREIARHGCHGFGKDGGGMCHFVSGHWDCGGRGRGFGFGVMRDDGSRGCGVDSRDGGFGSPGRGNMRGGRFGGRDGGFRGCGGRTDGNIGGRGGKRDVNFGGRGGMRDSGGGRDGNFGGRGGHKGVGFGGPNGGCDGNDRFEDNRGGGCGHGRGQFDNSRDGDSSRGRSYSRSPSRSRSWSRRRSYSRSQSRTPVRRERSRESRFDDGRDGDLIRGRSYSRSRSRSCRWSGSWSSGRSWSHSRSPRRSRTPVRRDRRWESRFDRKRDGDDSRGRSYSRSRSWSRSSSRSCSWSRGHSSRRHRSHTPVRRDRRRESRLDNRRDGDRSRGRDWSRSRSLSRSQSRSWSSSSRSQTPVRRERRRESKFDQKEPDVPIPLKT